MRTSRFQIYVIGESFSLMVAHQVSRAMEAMAAKGNVMIFGRATPTPRKLQSSAKRTQNPNIDRRNIYFKRIECGDIVSTVGITTVGELRSFVEWRFIFNRPYGSKVLRVKVKG